MEEEKKTCETCRCFYQHYMPAAPGKYKPIDWGHCVALRVKIRKTYSPACERYTAKKRG